MIVTLTGAYRNVGDYLIGARAKELLKTYVDADIVNLNRTSITPVDYDLMNKAKAVILCGGPAYQKRIYPDVYPIDYEKIIVPIIPLGLGWKSKLDDTPQNFAFTQQSLDFIKHIHSNIRFSSVRDVLTEQMIRNQGIDNVLMTGCPAWYDLDYLDQDYVHSAQVDQVVVSMPARYHPQIPLLLGYLKNRFPDSKKIITFHHGFWPRFNRTGLISGFEFARMSLVGMQCGFRPVDLSKDIAKLRIYDVPNSLHIGYRVHAHLYCLSHRKQSFLINEDIRGVGQAESIGLESFLASDIEIVRKIGQALDDHFSSGGEKISNAVRKMKDTFTAMVTFLQTIGSK
ncbi:MAG: polysaccharide pyruvyl transferase family protein [Alphaproteobacteria bacterium]|nr:polysaccharide pyruvyl transferase family protein [Alphaproteobacteria bacterium]